MAEEHGFQASEGHRLCVNNCGFFGSPATMDLCSKCYRDLRMKEEQGALAKAAFENKPSSSSTPRPAVSIPSPSLESQELVADVAVEAVEKVVVKRQEVVVKGNRCLTCRKRVGLTGFKCRCGMVLCGTHRYPEEHGCEFDYKTVGKEEIARANPVIKAEKLGKI
ncbi:hypothetical protein Drorol1_Dr00013819 [Drosera rotundifolia]